MRDPHAALAAVVPAANRIGLPREITSQLESLIDARGDLEVISICDEKQPRIDRWMTINGARYATYTYGQRLASISKSDIPVHGAAVDDVLALSDEPFRVIAQAGSGVVVQVGETTRSFQTLADLDAWAANAVVSEQSIQSEPTTAAAAPTPWTTGEKSVLWIRAEFPDDAGSPATDDQINAMMATSDLLFRDVSQDTCSFKGTIVPGTVRLSQPKDSYSATTTSYLTMRAEAVQLARAYDSANGGTGKYNADNYDRYIVICKKMPAYTWAGIASVGTKGLVLNGTTSGAVTAHELGHNHGLRHSHAWVPTANSAIGEGTHAEYGDAFDDMGSGQAGSDAGHFNAVQKFNLGYLGSESIQTLNTSGVYRIARHDHRQASGIRALKVPSSAAGVNYWFEYRYAPPFPSFEGPSVGVAELPRLRNGIVVHWDKAPSFASGPGTYLLDMTPTTTSGVPAPSDIGGIIRLLDDAALALGESFTDSAANLTITPIDVGGSSGNEWIDVYVSIGSTAGNRPPTVSAALNTSNPTARANVNFTASGSDPDGDTVYYKWDFGDGSFTSAKAQVTHQWLKGGTYTVTCTALDGRGGRTSTTIPVTVADPLLTWQRRANSLTSHYFYDVIFDGSRFIAVGSYVAAASSDGVNWTLGTGMTSKNYNYAVAYGNSRYVAVGLAGSVTTVASISSSSDGLTWTDRSTAVTAPQLLDVVFGGGRFVAVGDSGAIVTSTDGVTWSKITSGTTANLTLIRYDAGRFIAAGENGTYLTSTDGTTWQDCSIAGETSTARALAYYRDTWLAITSSFPTSDSGKRVAFRSSDGKTWSRIYVDVNSSMTGPVVVANSNLLLGVSRANDGRIFIAQDPFNWDDASVFPSSAVGSATNLSAAAEGNGTLVVVGLSGQIYTPTGTPYVVAPPTSQTATIGQTVSWTAQGYATGPFTYQWRKNGNAIAGATGATLTLVNIGDADAGSYTVAVTNASGTITTPAATLVVAAVDPVVNTGRLVNMSIRTAAGTGDSTLIVGLGIGGANTSGTKGVLVRGVGPTLGAFGVAGTLPDPVLTAYQGTTVVAQNDDWAGTFTFASVGAFGFAGTPVRDAAIYEPAANAGAYSVQIAGKNNATGIALAEIYDCTSPSSFRASTPRLVNVSARAQVGTGDNILIAGFVVGGSTPIKVLIRAAGPTLGAFGVNGSLANPKLELYNAANIKIGENDDWGGTAPLKTAFTSVGAFGFSSDTSKDAALVVTLNPGNYTAQISGVGSTTGVALVEVYELP